MCSFAGKDTDIESERSGDLPNSVAELVRASQIPKGRDLNQFFLPLRKHFLKLECTFRFTQRPC